LLVDNSCIMVLSKRIARSCIHLGFVQLVAGCAGVACGAVAKSKLTGPVGATIGLWAVYVSLIPHIKLLKTLLVITNIYTVSVIMQ
jgi:hypothetical protein